MPLYARRTLQPDEPQFRPVTCLEGDVWEMDGFESCAFYNIEPNEYRRILGRPPAGYAQDPFSGFHCELHVIVAKSTMLPHVEKSRRPNLRDGLPKLQGQGESVSPILPR